MRVHVSGDYSRFVDGEKEEFKSYVESKADKVSRFFNAYGDVLNVRISDGRTNIKGERARVAVGIGNGERFERKGDTVRHAFDKAFPLLVDSLREEHSQIVDHR